MSKNIKNHYVFLYFIIAICTLVTIWNWPVLTRLVNILVLLISIGMTTGFIFKNHWQTYQQAECTREKMIHNLGFDIIGLILTMGAAMYIGRLAGGYFGLRSGFWFGLIAGFMGGFVVAWMVRSVWGRLVRLEA